MPMDNYIKTFDDRGTKYHSLENYGLKPIKRLKTEMSKMEWKKIESEPFKFEVAGDVIEGILASVDKSEQFGNMNYKIQTKEGLKTVFGTVVLDSLMSGIRIGSDIKIEFAGLKENKKKGQNAIKLFNVFTK
jgi:hypothetical protein